MTDLWENIKEKFFWEFLDFWKAILAIVIVLVLESAWIRHMFIDYDFRVYWNVRNLIVIPLILYRTLMMSRLQKGMDALADGNLEYQIRTGGMIGIFREWGKSFNCIAQCMSEAVEQRIKSERMKTELITNVSHDLKTPLTSVINYANLIGQESCENERIKEYAEVLLRQSERLRRLIEDLVEASKAATGNLEVELEPCEAEILLTQAAGEFEERLLDAGLELKLSHPKESVRIMADGRRLWRVFDNLMNNICKYAQSGTRVYLSLEETEGQAIITFKNTSRAPLNVSADELLERFTRGDVSRTTEGNGLGMSIAKSLTELQKGTFDLSIDGDLFKVILKFPKLT